jgi:hypothetical protein
METSTVDPSSHHFVQPVILPQNLLYTDNPKPRPGVISIAVDSEWHGTDNSWLSTTFCVDARGSSHFYHFIDMTLPEDVQKTWEFLSRVNWDFFLPCAGEFEFMLKTVIEMVCAKLDFAQDPPVRVNNGITEVELLLYYSPKDLEYSVGWEFMKELYERTKKPITQKRNLRGKFELAGVDVTLFDLKGWGTSLANLADSVGVEIKDKSLMDDYKASMRDGYIERPEDAFYYARGDVDVLHRIRHEFIKNVQWVRHDVIGIPRVGECDPFEDLPKTTGSLVAHEFLKWLKTRAEDPAMFEFALKKLGKLKTGRNYKKDLDPYRNAVDHITTRRAFKIAEAARSPMLKDFNKCKFEFTGLSQCSVGYFAKRDTSAAFNALVQGGRCNNERPTAYRAMYGADIDLNGCYGTALIAFIYPVGLPTVWGFRPGQRRVTLKQWLSKHETELVDNLWTVTVEGELSFCQDLIFSKIVTQDQINKAAWGDWDKESEDPDRDDDLAHIPGDFALIRKEIQNGIITSDILRALKAIATNVELGELMKLKVVCGVAYLKGDRLDDVECWIDHTLADEGEDENVRGLDHKRSDERTRKWVGVPLADFIGKLVDVRGVLKKQAKTLDEGVEKTNLNAKQNGLKLFINTQYGDFASPYFEVGNTVLANNITARARLGTWMLNKALHTRQSITDGGIYTPREVPFLAPGTRGKPGLAILADNTKWLNGRSDRTLGQMGGVDWEAAIKSNDVAMLKRLDELALEHVNHFWGNYSDDAGAKIKLPFAIEHKLENTFTVAAYMSKAHYALRTISKGDVFKIRGAKDFKEEDKRKSPMYELLTNILNGSDAVPDKMPYDYFYLLKVSKYLQAAGSTNDEAFKAVRDKRPGDSVVEERRFRLNNTHFPQDTVKEFERMQANARRTSKDGKELEKFERFRDKGLWVMVKKMLNDVRFE